MGSGSAPIGASRPAFVNLQQYWLEQFLVERASDPAVQEVVLAINATIDGQTTVLGSVAARHPRAVVWPRLAAWDS